MIRVFVSIFALLATATAFAAQDCSFQARAAAFNEVYRDMRASSFTIAGLTTDIVDTEVKSASQTIYYINVEATEATDVAEYHMIVTTEGSTCKVVSVESGGF